MDNPETDTTGIRKEVSITAISVDKVYMGDFQKEGTKSAQIRQTVLTKSFYPSKQVSTDLQDNPFNLSEFGFEESQFDNEEKRVAWIDVPEIITNKDDVQAKIPTEAVLYRVMSNRPILTTSQKYSVEINQKSNDDYANAQVVRFSKGHDKEGQLVVDLNGKPQYRAIFYSNIAKEDVDMRTVRADDFFASEQISSELSGVHVIAQQTL